MTYQDRRKYLSNIVIDEFGLIKDKSLGPLCPGFNVIYGKNESGKSTFAQFIEGTISGWLPNRSSLNSYLSPQNIRKGHLEFKDFEGNTFSFSRSDKKQSSVSASIDENFPPDRKTFEIVNMMTSDSLLKLDNDNRIGQLSAAGASTRVSPQLAIESLQNDIKNFSSKKSNNDKSLVLIQQEIQNLNLSIVSQENYINNLSSNISHEDQYEHSYNILQEKQNEIIGKIQQLKNVSLIRNDIEKEQSVIAQLKQIIISNQIEITKTKSKAEVLTQQCNQYESNFNAQDINPESKNKKITFLGLIIFAIAALGAIVFCALGQIIPGIAMFVLGAVFLSIWMVAHRTNKQDKQKSNLSSRELYENNSRMRDELNALNIQLKNLEENEIRLQTTIDEKSKQIKSKESLVIEILCEHNLAQDSNEREVNTIINQLKHESISIQAQMKNIISEREALRQSAENIENRKRELDDSKTKMSKLLSQKRALTKELFEKVIAVEILTRANSAWLENGGYDSNKVASNYLKMMTCGKWDSIDSKSYEISSSITGDCMPVVKLSRSTTQQLFLAIRMSVLQSPECLHKTTPVICDDILVDFDQSRQESAIKALYEFSKHRQVIMFTANKNVVQLAQKYQECNCIEL